MECHEREGDYNISTVCSLINIYLKTAVHEEINVIVTDSDYRICLMMITQIAPWYRRHCKYPHPSKSQSAVILRPLLSFFREWIFSFICPWLPRSVIFLQNISTKSFFKLNSIGFFNPSLQPLHHPQNNNTCFEAFAQSCWDVATLSFAIFLLEAEQLSFL